MPQSQRIEAALRRRHRSRFGLKRQPVVCGRMGGETKRPPAAATPRVGNSNRRSGTAGTQHERHLSLNSIQSLPSLQGISPNLPGGDIPTSPVESPKSPVVRLADTIDRDPERLAAHEAAYRRGVHQALAFAGDIADEAATLQEARRTLTKAENIAGRLRFIRKDEGRGALLDHIRTSLSRGRARKP